MASSALEYAMVDEVETALAALLEIVHRVPVRSVVEAEQLHGHAVRLRDEIRAVQRSDEGQTAGIDRFREVHHLPPIGGSRV